jgi:hypothetical protein
MKSETILYLGIVAIGGYIAYSLIKPAQSIAGSAAGAIGGVSDVAQNLTGGANDVITAIREGFSNITSGAGINSGGINPLDILYYYSNPSIAAMRFLPNANQSTALPLSATAYTREQQLTIARQQFFKTVELTGGQTAPVSVVTTPSQQTTPAANAAYGGQNTVYGAQNPAANTKTSANTAAGLMTTRAGVVPVSSVNKYGGVGLSLPSAFK